MYSTKYGQYDGDSWEALMQICFRIKYEQELYQSVPASSGDCGIEGFTKTGKVFQCYCPDNNVTSKALYEKQRDKITTDLKKLDLYKKKLAKFLDGVTIKQWILVTPENRMNDLILHCNTKRQEILKLNLPFIDPTFQVLIHDIDNFAREIPIALNSENNKLLIDKEKLDGKTIVKWKDEEIDLVENALRKHSKRFPKDTSGVDKKINTLTDATIESFLDLNTILMRWRSAHPDDYEKYLMLISQIEKDVQEMCMFPSSDNNELYKQLRTLVRERLNSNFGYLNDITIESLTNGAVADWLLRCPLDFE